MDKRSVLIVPWLNRQTHHSISVFGDDVQLGRDKTSQQIRLLPDVAGDRRQKVIRRQSVDANFVVDEV